MRITGGIYCGRTVEMPESRLPIRPAMDRMRESLFATLGDLAGLSFLDLFSGSGIIALEAASRGAWPVTCVERDRAKFPTLLKNVAISERRIECKALPVELFLQRNQVPFDIVFLDPPFPYAYRMELLEALSNGFTLKDGGLALLHFPHEEQLPQEIGSLYVENEKHYGRSSVRFYRKKTISI